METFATIGKRASSRDLLHVDRTDFEIRDELVRREVRSAGVFAVGPERGRAAVGVTDAEVVEVDRERTRLAAGEDDAVLAQGAGRGAGEADDAMLPDVLAVGDAGAGALVATELIDRCAGFEQRTERLRVVAFER